MIMFSRAINKVKKVYKGHKDRMRVEAVKEELYEKRRMMFFETQATVIQKWYFTSLCPIFISFRGYMCRKYNHDYFARKQFLGHIMNKTKLVQDQMEEQAKASNIDYQKSKEEMARAEFTMITGNLHHLMSTKTQAGIYNSPYTASKPQAFNVDIETHLQTSFKSNYQWKPPAGNRISFYKELAKEEFMIRKKLLQINKGINLGTHDPVAAVLEKTKEQTKTQSWTKPKSKVKL